MNLARHAFCWSLPEARPLAACSDAETAEIGRWLAAGRPAIHRRLRDGEGASGVPLGIALPSAAGRRRLGFQVPPQDVVRSAPPPMLAEAAEAAPAAWRGALAGIAADAVREGLDVRVYGSLAWQHLTGEAYLRAASDLDLAVWVGDRATLDRAVALFAAWDGAAGMRVDGEVIFPGEAAVNWRELRSDAGEVLVKRPRATALAAVEALMVELRAA